MVSNKIVAASTNAFSELVGCPVNLAQETQELLGPMTRQAFADYAPAGEASGANCVVVPWRWSSWGMVAVRGASTASRLGQHLRLVNHTIVM